MLRPFSRLTGIALATALLMLVIAAIQDGHANLWSSLRVRPPIGDCQLPVNLRFIENRPVVTGYSSDDLGKTSGLQIGDVVTKIDGQGVTKLVSEIAPFYAASNEAGRLRDIGRSLTLGKCGVVSVAVWRGSGSLEFDAERVPSARLDLTRDRRHDQPRRGWQFWRGQHFFSRQGRIGQGRQLDQEHRGAAGSRVCV